MKSLVLCALLAVPAVGRTLTIGDYLLLRRITSVAVAPDGRRLVYAVSQPSSTKDRSETTLWVANIDGSDARELAKGNGAEWSPDSRQIAYIANAQIFVTDLTSAPRQVTSGSLSPSALHWSPDGAAIGFAGWVERSNEWPVELPPPPAGAKWAEPPHVVDTLHYRSDGSGYIDIGTTQLFVVPASGGEARQITKGSISVGFWWDGSQGVTWSWSADAKSIVFDGLLTGDQDLRYEDCDINVVDIATGAVRQLTTQRGLWSAPAVSPDGRWVAFAGFSAKTESYHAQELYVIPFGGGNAKKISGALDRDVAELHWASDSRTIYFTAQDHGAQQIDRATIDGTVAPVTRSPDVFSLAGVTKDLLVATHTAVREPAEVVTIPLDAPGRINAVTHLNDALRDATLAAVDDVHLHAADGAEIQGWLYKPVAVAGRKYPLILFIHGGPVIMGDTRFNFRLHYYASKGYFVLMLNPRSSSGYGTAWTNAVSYDMPGLDYDDLMRGVDATLQSHPEIDPHRLFVAGGSYGGTLTAWTIGHTTRFAAAVVESPNIDWISWSGTSDLPLSASNFFFRKPFWDDPLPWLKHSPLMYASNVTTPTLIMCGERDERTPIGQAEELYVALKTRGIPARLLRFPADSHLGLPPSDVMRRLQYTIAWLHRFDTEAATTCQDVPFHWTPGQIEIEVEVNGTKPRWFILDSGAEYSIIRSDMPAELGLQTTPRMSRDFASGVSFDINGIRLANQDVMVMALDNFRKQHRDIQGLIGYDFFVAHAVTIDYARRIVRRCDAASFRPAADDVAVPLEFSGRLPVVPAQLTLADGRTLKLRAMVDTGAQVPMIVRYPFAEAHKLFDGAGDTNASPSLNGPQAMKVIATKCVGVGPATLDVESVRVFGAPTGSGGATETDALIGNELLRRSRVTFDYAHRRLLLAPRSAS